MARDNDGAYSLDPSGDATETAGPARRTQQYTDVEHRTKSAKTSAAAVFALVFGVAALISVLTVILAPVAVLLALVGIVLGVVGLKMAKRVGVTGKGVAIGALVLSGLALLLGLTALIGITSFLNDDAAVARLEEQIDNLREDLPESVDVPNPDVDVDLNP